MANADFVISDATKTEIKSNSFDIVASIGLLEHFEDPRELLIESLRIAKNGDIFFYVVPDQLPHFKKYLINLII